MPLPETLPEGAVILHESIAAGLAEMLGLAPDAADQAAYDVLRRVLETCGGEYFYVPKDIRLAAHGRDIEVWRKFTGHNQRQLAREFGITVQYVYQIIARQREKDKKSARQSWPYSAVDPVKTG